MISSSEKPMSRKRTDTMTGPEESIRSRKNSAQYSDEGDRDGECGGDCLVNISKACISSSTSPKLNVWGALEQAAKQSKKRRKLFQIAEKKPEGPPSSCIGLLAWGCLLCMIGAASLIWTPFDILMRERLKMVRGLPAYDWWQSPPDEVFLRAYVFNYTNTEEFMNGQADKLKVEEVGPYIFMEKLYHENPTFHDNGTMTYTAIRKAIYLPHLNKLSLNATIITPNLAFMAAASYLAAHGPAFMRFGFKILTNSKGSTPFKNVTVDNYFWNFTDPLFITMKMFAPDLVPTTNAGILQQVYQDFTDNVTVFTQPSNGNFKFFKLDQYNGHPRMMKYENETCDSIQGSTEGVHYHQFIKRTDTVVYLRKSICRAVPLYYSRDLVVRGINTFVFELPNTTYARPENPEDECYRHPSYPVLLAGLTDISPCYFNMPIASSFPHLMHAEEHATRALEGLTPNNEKHGSAAIVEPNTGVPMTAWARSQSNLYMHDMKWISKLERFSDMPLPMFWLEYKQEGLPGYVYYPMYLTVNIIKPGQFYFSIGTIALGLVIYLAAFKRIWARLFALPTKPYALVSRNPEHQLKTLS